MAEERSSSEPLDALLKGTRDLLRPEEIVQEATRDIVKAEIRQHLEKTLTDNPQLAKDLRDAVRALLEARAMEYAALLRVGTCTARLGLQALSPKLREALTKDVVDLVSRELGQIVERSL
jgi:hypothetical protein